jgi:hypothetical protein
LNGGLTLNEKGRRVQDCFKPDQGKDTWGNQEAVQHWQVILIHYKDQCPHHYHATVTNITPEEEAQIRKENEWAEDR